MNTTQPAGLNKTYVGFDNLRAEPKLLLDDERTPQQVFELTKEEVYTYPNWFTARSYNEFVDYIMNHPMPKVISFDHDLGGLDEMVMSVEGELEQQEAWDNYHTSKYREKSGYDCMKWLVDYCYERKIVFPRVLIHTQNPVGYDNIKYYYRNAIRHKMIKIR
jgi:hypothetical protein